MISVDDSAGTGPTGPDGHVQGVHDQGGVLLGVDGPADDLAAAGIQHRRAVDLALASGMLGDVRDPPFVQRQTMELPIDEIVCAHHAAKALDPCRAGQPTDARARHQRGDQPARSGDAHADGEFRVYAAVPVGSSRGLVDLPDQPCQPLSTEFRGTGRKFAVPVVALAGDAQDAATGVDRSPGVDESIDHRVRPFGQTPSSSSSQVAARQTIASSCSSWRMRPRAARSSADPWVLRPGLRP